MSSLWTVHIDIQHAHHMSEVSSKQAGKDKSLPQVEGDR
jgi:hypothetical protein